ncbi:MAG: FtsW/RodA/SpoVE family cell cycle protein [Chloroflexota bacterium]|nr:FtsW/RodA/SpoVE family cell cycle protein [Chloroflexota bacterium]
MVRAGRARLVELELLIVPSLIMLGGLLLVVLVDRGDLVFDWQDVYTAGAFVAALLFVHAYLSLSRFQGDQVVFPTVALLTALGLVMMQRLDILSSKADLQGIAVRQTLWVFLGLAAMLVTVVLFGRLNRLRRYKYTLFAFGILLMIGLLVPGLGREINGARLWYDLGPILFQPSELLKVILVIFFAAYLDERRDLLASEYRVGPLKLPPLPYLAPMVAMWGASMLVLVVLKDLGSALLFFTIFLAMLYAVTGRALYVWVLGGLFVAGAFFAYRTFGHVRVRVDTWLYPFEDVAGTGFQISQSLFALATGGLYGTGLGYGSPDVIPFTHTDMVFSAIAEELGLMGTLAVLGLYLVLVYRGFYIAMHVRSGFNQLVGVGITTIFGAQSLIIIAGDVKLIPLTGITLPFVAYGGSSLLTNYVMVGLLLGLSADRREWRA